MSLTAPAGAHTTLKVSPARPSALLLAVAFACEPAPSAPCGGRCGPGTVCEADLCVAAPVAAEPAPEATPTKKRGRRRKSGTGAPAAGEPEDPAGGAPEEAPPPPFVAVDDSRIPEFSAEQSQTIDLEAGSERPSEAVLDKHFARITPRIHDCVVTASRYGEVGRGRLAGRGVRRGAARALAGRRRGALAGRAGGRVRAARRGGGGGGLPAAAAG